METIIWAVDPTQKPKEAQDIVNQLKTWSRSSRCNIQPVSIFPKSTLNFLTNTKNPWDGNFEDFADESMILFLKKLGAHHFLPPKAIFTPAISNHEMSKALIKYAESQKASYIFLNTHAKKTRNPFRIGGFAETLIATSPIPILTLNPLSSSSKKISTILFPTDFSTTSKNALHRLIPVARKMNAKVTLFHQIEQPNYYYSEVVVFMQSELKMATEAERKLRERKLYALVQEIEKEGVKASFVIEVYKKNLGTQIVEAAQRNGANLISLSTRTKPLARAFIGSVARDVLIQAKCPVLTFFRPKIYRKKTNPRNQHQKFNKNEQSSETLFP